MTVNVSLEDAWEDSKGNVHKIVDMDNKSILDCMIHVTDVIRPAWEIEQYRIDEPVPNAPKPYVYSLPDRYLLCPPVYWNMRNELRGRGWMG